MFHSDFIAGFPSETESDFEDILNTIIQFNLHGASIFVFSDVKKAKSSKLPNKVPLDIIMQRISHAKKFFENKGYSTSMIGDRLEVIRPSRPS